MSTASTSEGAPSRASIPDLSWFCCICCARRPMPHASFSMLLTTCSHIVCSSCWNGRGNGECPSCGMKANTLNLSTTKELPKQLEPYYKTPVELIKRLLAICEFQEYQKRQTLERRKVAWVLINHQRAKEDFEKEYAECKQLLTALNLKKRALRRVAENLRRKGKDPVQVLRGKVSEEVIKVIAEAPPTPGTSAPSTPFFLTPLSRPPSTSTPAVPGAVPPTVEFVEPKKLPHTMRGSVTSKAVRRSPSNPQTPLLQPQFTNTPGSMLPAKRPRVTTVQPMDVFTVPVGQHTRHSGRPSIPTSQPVRQPHPQMGHPGIQTSQPVRQPHPLMGHPGIQTRTPVRQPHPQVGHPGIQTGQPVRQPHPQMGQPRIQTGQPVRQPQMGHPKMHSGQLLAPTGRSSLQVGQPTKPPMKQPAVQPRQSVAQFSQPMMYSGRPGMQFGQPALNSGRRVLQPGQLPSVQPIIPPHCPIQQSSQTPRPSSRQQAATLETSGGSARIRAVPPSSISQRIFPSPMSSQLSHSTQSTPSQRHTISPSHQRQQPAITSGRTAGIEKAARISLRPSPQSHSHSMSQVSHSARGHVKTPTNPSPLLRGFTTTPQSSSPWQLQRGQGSHVSVSPWKPGCTPSPGMRMSGGSASGGSGRTRLTPMKS